MASLQIAARTDFDALAATLTSIERHHEVITGTRFLEARETSRVAVHEALLTVETQATGHTSGRLSIGLLVADCLIDFFFRIAKPFLRRSAMGMGALLLPIEIGFDYRSLQRLAIPGYLQYGFATQFGVR